MKLRRKTYSLLKNWNLNKIVLLIIFICLVFSCDKSQNTNTNKKKTNTLQKVSYSQIKIDSFPILSSKRLEMTRDYAIDNYGIKEYRLLDPKMIVIHYTVIPSLEKTLQYFKPDSLHNTRKKIIKKSPLNVGVHFVIDKDGSIHSLLPDTIMGRHLIGFNHISIGIENVAKDSTDLTQQQLNSNAKLVKYLADKHKSIKFLIGHFEYDNSLYPHYKLLIAKDSSYTPYKKFDPGTEFIENLRKKIKNDYELTFEK